MLESFVDPVHFRGTCYRDAGWEQVGSTRGFRRDGHEFYFRDSHPKQIWMKSLHAKARQWLASEAMPEPWAGFEKPLPPKRVADRLGAKGLGSLREQLDTIPDWRRTNGRQYPLSCCLALLISGCLAGCRTLEKCVEFASTLTQSQLRALRSWRNPKTRQFEAPKKTTLWRIAAAVDAELLEEAVNQWLAGMSLAPEAIAIDGKSLRATANNEDGGAYVVSALNHCSSSPFFLAVHAWQGTGTERGRPVAGSPGARSFRQHDSDHRRVAHQPQLYGKDCGRKGGRLPDAGEGKHAASAPVRRKRLRAENRPNPIRRKPHCRIRQD